MKKNVKDCRKIASENFVKTRIYGQLCYVWNPSFISPYISWL